MAKQLNLLSAGTVIPTALHTEMEQSYLEYAMSVIVGRALPDVRDGLKPVHRRILYAMHELGLTPDRPYRKCARVVGDVLGKYHPHGDQAVYDALVRMVQSFSSRHPLLDGHGNFGSVDDDPPAAMRYTETRLSVLANATLLEDIGEETVEFTGNFDNSQQEPLVLPAQLPVLLLNGCSGIAVGMATNIPPHNLGEVVDALVALIDRPSSTIEELLEIIPGPDFPTGGEIVGKEGIQEAYTTGRGSIPIRAITQIEEIQPGKGRHRRSAIIVTELPFQVNKAALLEKIAALINQGKIEGIADLRDESDREGLRVVIELRKDVSPEAILEQLFRQTQLQTNFGTIMLALVDGQPRQLTLKEMLQEFLRFREQTLERRYTHQLHQAQARLHIVEGLRLALADIDAVIDCLRRSPDGSSAKVLLQETFDLSDRQADAILAMPLRRLTGLEQTNLQQEHDQLQDTIQTLETLLKDRRVFLKQLKKDLKELKKRYGNPRRTHIAGEEAIMVPAEVVPTEETPVALELTQKGYIRAIKGSNRTRRKAPAPDPSRNFQENRRDMTLYQWNMLLNQQLLVFNQAGKAYAVRGADLPQGSGRDRGRPLPTLLPDSAHDVEIVATFPPTVLEQSERFIFLSQSGKIKALGLEDFQELTSRGLTCLKLPDGDGLGWVLPMQAEADLVIATSAGRVLRFPSEEVPDMTRTAQGNRAIRLLKQETIAGIQLLAETEDVLLLSEQGYCKRLAIDTLRLGHPGDLGTQLILGKKSDRILRLLPTQGIILVISEANQIAYLDPAEIPVTGKTEPTMAFLKVPKGDRIATAVPL
jgi:DNA gyrase subunit A